MSRAICVNVSVRVVRSLSTSAAGRDDFALERPLGFLGDADVDEIDGDADDSTASSALARKIRLRSDEQQLSSQREVQLGDAAVGTVTGFGSDDAPSFHAMTL